MYSRRAFLQSSAGAGLVGLARPVGAQGPVEPGPGRALRAGGFRGQIITPADPRYKEARRVFIVNPRRPAQPQIIAMCSDEQDIQRAVAFARDTKLELAVRAGGHDMLGASMCNGLVIDLSAMQAIEVDPRRGLTRVGAGVRAGKLNEALSAHGLSAALGCDANVGVTGLAMSGGLGWLAGRHGAACDQIVSARLVTADGRVLRVGAGEHRDLLWALRGGGGNFGVVSELTLRAHPRPAVTQGIVALRGTRIADLLRRHRDFLAAAGDDVDLETFILPGEAEPRLFIKACYSGDPAGAERVLAPLRGLGEVLADDVAATPYTGVIHPTGAIAPLFRSPPLPRGPGDVPGLHVASASLAPVSDAVAALIEDAIAKARLGWFVGIAHYVHGAASRASRRHSAMLRTDRLTTVYFGASWRRPQDAEPQMAWADEAVTALQPHAAPTYVNYMTSGAPSAVRRAYGPNYRRLAGVKRVYDPTNLFRGNRNISPA